MIARFIMYTAGAKLLAARSVELDGAFVAAGGVGGVSAEALRLSSFAIFSKLRTPSPDRSARLYRRCNRLLARVDDAIERGDRATAERLMGRVRVALAG